ncbi:MAG TPA: methyl-accepting chemotaxis protein [Sedimenticola thiotaurini]|uniref:Methyl-accepting chemotaxis protein n=1 Tax=Sedimenticola thiotaurini TaxID=1543721 RepID=A0A831RIX3_9GAMM|nr:methyl-accepting chemotaxis protein [Sedimenticola thiotaurini]
MNRTLFWRLFFPILGVVSLVIGGIAWYVPTMVRQQAEAAALEQAEKTVSQFKTIRAYYTRNVIAKVLGKGGIGASFDHQDDPNAVPLPATMIHDLSQLLADKGTRLKLYSAYPFPNRSERRLDPFQRQAWEAVTRDPEHPYVQTVTREGRTSVRVGIADRMVAQACVGCHNSRPDTPKNDWKLGDVRGVLEVEMPIDDQLAAGAALSRFILGIVVAGALAIFVTLFLIYRRTIGRRLDQVALALNEIADGDGDLSRRLGQEGEHEVARIGAAFNRFIDRLSGTLREVMALTGELTRLAHEMSSASSEASSGLTQQQEETRQVASAVNEMEERAREIAAGAAGAAEATEATDTATREGAGVVQESIESTHRLAEDIGRAAAALGRLQADSDDIGGVLDVIGGIAEQTNLLALNAAIEAARAGEQGRGFAVVADEVRNLAGRTQESTREIQQMTERLREATEEVVAAMESSRDQAESAVGLAGSVGGQLEHIRESVETLRQMTGRIAAAADQQGRMVAEVNRNLAHINDASGAVSAAGEASSRQALEVSRMSDRLQQLIGHFRIA